MGSFQIKVPAAATTVAATAAAAEDAEEVGGGCSHSSELSCLCGGAGCTT